MANVCKRVPIFCGLFLLFFFCRPVSATANELTITPQEVDGQRVTTSDVTLPLDGRQHNLTLSVTNFSEQNQLFRYQGVQAMTDAKGQLTYGTTGSFATEVLVSFEQLFPEASLEMQAGETKEIALNFALPQIAEGEALGALQFRSQEGTYGLPMKLAGTKGLPKATLAVTKIAGELVENLPALKITIANSTPLAVVDEPVNLTVVHSQFFGLVKKSWQIKLADVTWAPNGELNYPISMNGTALPSGNYQITGTIGEKVGQANVNESFTLTRAQAAAINQQAPAVNDATLRWGIPVLIGLTVILILVITVALRQNRKRRISQQ